MLPYLIWSIAFVFLHNELVSHGLIDRQTYSSEDVFHRIKMIVSFQLFTEDLMGALWFLPVLFLAEVFAFSVLKLLEQRYKTTTIMQLAAFAVFAETGKILISRIPNFWIVGNAMYASWFFAFGHCIRQYAKTEWMTSLAAMVPCLLVLLAGYFLWRTSLTSPSAAKAPLYAFSAISGIMLVMYLSSIMLNFPVLDKVLVFVGNHTLSILTWHFCAFKFVTWCLLSSGLEGSMRDFPTVPSLSSQHWFAYSAGGIILPLMVSEICGIVLKTLDNANQKRFRQLRPSRWRS